MAILITSDIHLSEAQPEIANLFFNFLYEHASRAEALYILGDLFDAWIGDDDETAFHKKVIQSLKAVVDSGVPIHLMPGNRDFLLGKCFAKSSGCQLIKDPCIVKFYGLPVLLTHGDGLYPSCQYQWYRRFVRNPLVKRWILHQSLKKRLLFKTRLRHMSQAITPAFSQDHFDSLIPRVIALAQKYSTTYLIQGHIHQFHSQLLMTPNKTVRWIALNAWDNVGSALACMPDPDTKQLNFLEQKIL